MSSRKKKTPRGIRNNNPLNLFKGMCKVENGCIIDEVDIFKGYEMAVTSRPKSKM